MHQGEVAFLTPSLMPRLRTGGLIDQVTRSIVDLERDLTNSRSSPGIPAAQMRDEYLGWTHRAERQLRHLFRDPEAWEMLFSTRYWHIRGIRTNAAGSSAMIHDEANSQAIRLQGYVDQLRHEANVFAPSDPIEAPVVLDTNVLIHFQPLVQINWLKEINANQVRIVLPLAVVDELDKQTYVSNPTICKRAKSVIAFLQKLRKGRPADHAVQVPSRPGATCQILLDPEGHRRFSNVDQEILSRAQHVSLLRGQPVIVGSADYGVQLRAEAQGLRIWSPRDNLRQDRD